MRNCPIQLANMPILLITDGEDRILMDKQEAGTMELKLNVSSKGHLWKHLGDAFFAVKTESPDAPSRLVITKEQMAFLKTLQERKGWEDCKDL